MPLKKVAAQKPVISPTTPPPNAIKASDLSNFKSASLDKILEYVEKDLDFSPSLFHKNIPFFCFF